jgi:4-amino-4-deoxy-L-arabinose transferase-like glycosyltransferase
MNEKFSSTWILLFCGLVVLLCGSFQLPLLDRDEPRFSRATVEMAEKGNWVIPYFNGEYRFDKPPLTYWWMGVHHWIFGVNEFSSRLHSILATLLVGLWMIYRGKIWVGDQAARIGGLMWILNLQVWQHGRLALADMPMVLGVCLAMDGLWHCIFGDGKQRKAARFLLWGALAFGFLAKGPIVLALPLLVWLALVISKKSRFREIKHFQPITGLIVFLLLIGLWGIPALVMTNGEFGREGLGKHVIERGVSSFNDRSYSPFFYLITFFLSIFPWCLRLITLGKPLLGFRKTNAGFFLFCWFVSPFLIFSFYSTQLPHYILPGFPAFFLLLAKGLSEIRLNQNKLMPWVEIFFSIALLLAIGFGKDFIDPNFPETLIPFLGFVLLSFLWIPWFFLRNFKIFTAVSIICLGVASFFAARTIRAEHLTLRIANVLEGQTKMNEFRYSSFAEPSLVFYLGGPWRFVNEGAQDPNFQNSMQIVRKKPQEETGWQKVQGFNPGRGKRETVWVRLP